MPAETNESLQFALDKLQRDTIREEFRTLVASGRRWCWYAAIYSHTPEIIVENHPEKFTTTYNFRHTAEAIIFEKEQNKKLGLTDVEVQEIIISSMLASNRLRRRRA
jgi:hypothetical protein